MNRMASFRIPSSCFFPAPDVDSACVTLDRRTNPLLPHSDRVLFERVVKRGFSQRRKMMFKLLKTEWPKPHLKVAFGEVGLSPQVRAEKVSLEQFVRLTQLLKGETMADYRMSDEIFDVVNDRDEIVDRRPRGEVHRLGLKHRAVHVLIFNSRGELFLQKRSMKKDCFPGVWDCRLRVI